MKFHNHTQENDNSIIQRQLDKVRAKMDTNQLQTQTEQHQKIDVCLFNGILLKIIHPRTESKDLVRSIIMFVISVKIVRGINALMNKASPKRIPESMTKVVNWQALPLVH